MTFLAVAIGVAFVSGVTTLTDTMSRSFDDLISTVNTGTDAWVRGKSQFTASAQFGGGEQRPRVEATVAERVAQIPGVAAAEPFVRGGVDPFNADGEPAGQATFGPPIFGANWREQEALNPFTLVEGSRAPEGPDEVVLDKGLADELGYAVGDRVTIDSDLGVITPTVVGIARFGSADSPLGAKFVMFDLTTAETLLAEPGEVDGIAVAAEPGLDQAELRDVVADGLDDPALEVVTGAELTAETQDRVAEWFRFFRQTLLVFAVLAVVVGAFVIYTSFSFIVAQRQRQVALLRAVGASRRQVLGSVLLESLAVGILASLAGYAAGVALAAALSRLMSDGPSHLVFLPQSIALALFVGIAVTVFSAVFPAWRAARIPPVAAMLDTAIDLSHRARWRLPLGVLLLVAGAVPLVMVLTGGGGLRIGGVGIFLLFVGLVVLGPIAARPVTVLLGAGLPASRGVVGRLAQQNASRNPRRTGSTASTLMICMGAVTLILVVVASIRASIDDLVDRRFVGDFVVSSGQGFTGEGIPLPVTDQLDALDEVDAAAGVRFGLAEIDGVGQGIAGVDPDQAFRLYDVGVAAGDVTALGADGIAVYEQVAEDNGWQVGDVIPLRFAGTGVQDFRVTALTETEELLGPFVVGSAAFEANLDVPGYAQVLVRLADGVDAAAGRAAIEPIVAPYPSVELQDLGEFKAASRAQFDPLLVGVFTLLALTVVVAVIGMINTLVLSVVERTREIGLLRAVGATRGQVRATIRWEALLIAGFGVVAALGCGVVFGRVVVRALADEGFTTFAVPVVQLIGVAMATGGISLAAAVFPAIWAGRRSVLEAIATQ